MGRRVEPLGPEELRRISRYPWPGNVRELQNVIERAIIFSAGSRLELARALPVVQGDGEVRDLEVDGLEVRGLEVDGWANGGAGNGAGRPAPTAGPQDGPPAVLTASQIEDLERGNMLRALERSGWKVAGDDGAARLLGLPPSTLASRMRALGIRRPGR
jgi:transcriptional regulator with GAF, ATPase, and Fis domain